MRLIITTNKIIENFQLQQKTKISNFHLLKLSSFVMALSACIKMYSYTLLLIAIF